MDETILAPITRTLVLCEMTQEIDATWRPPERILRGLRVSQQGIANYLIKVSADVSEAFLPDHDKGPAVSIVADRVNELIKLNERIDKVLESWT